MSPDQVGDLLNKCIMTIFVVTAPVLFVGLAIGFFVSIFQAATQINEVTLVFIPKMLGSGLVLWQGGSWMFEQLEVYVHEISIAVQAASTSGGM